MDIKIIDINDDLFNSEVLLNKKFVLVIFWSKFCGPCKLLMSLLEDIYKNYINKIKFVKLDVNKSDFIVKKYNIINVPTIMLFNKGVLLSTKIGFIDKKKINSFLNSYI